MNNCTLALALVVTASMAGLEGCRRQPAPAPAPTTTVNADAAARRRADSIATANQRRADSIAAASAAAARDAAANQQAQAELANVLAQRVYFDYDRDQLRADGMAALDAKAAILNANPSLSLVVTGHTDERGTAEYNLALGQRRAAAVKRYLASKGVAEGRIATQSLGDSQPAVQGTDESAYQQNRRAEFDARGMSGALVRPRE